MRLILFFFAVLFLIPPVSAETITIEPYYANPELQYYHVNIDNGVKIAGKDWSATFQPYFRLNNGYFITWNALPPNIDKKLWKTQLDETRWKYGADFSYLTDGQKNSLASVYLHRTDANNLTASDVRLDGSCIVVKETVRICHDDILERYQILSINRTDVVINVSAENFILNPDGTWNISFDPTVTITSKTVMTTSVLNNVIAEAGNGGSLNFTHLNISSTAPYDSLFGYWNFDGDAINAATFTAYDFSSYNRNGNDTGTAVVNPSSGLYGNGLWVDGNSDWIDFPDITFTGAFAISMWFFSSVWDADYRMMISRGPSGTYSKIGTNNDQAHFLIRTVTTSSTTNIDLPSANAWHHIALVRNSTNIVTVYVDNGAPTILYSGAAQEGSSVWGVIGYSSSQYWNGTIDEVMLFNTSLTAAQVSAIYTNQSARFVTSGTQTINNINISGDGTENRVNISLNNCQTNLGSNLSGQLGVYVGASCVNTPGFYVEPDYYDCGNIGSEIACSEQSNCLWVAGSCTTILYPECGAFQSEATCTGSNQGDVCSWEYTHNLTTVNFNNCAINNYPFSGNPNKINLRIGFSAGNSTNPFYSPLVIGNITLTSWTESEAPPATDISTCGVLSLPNTAYTQTANIVPQVHPCINITAENVTFNGNGKTIINKTCDCTGIYSNKYNTTIRNAVVVTKFNTVGSAVGVWLSGSNDSSIITSNLSYGVSGIYLQNSNRLTVTNSTISGNGLAGFYPVTQSSDINVTNTVLSGNGLDVTIYDNSKNIILLNCSYNQSLESADPTSYLFRRWYYRAYVNDTAGNPVSGATFSAYNTTGSLELNFQTNAAGYTPILGITEYSNTAAWNYYSNYTLNANKTGYVNSTKKYNVSVSLNNINDYFTLSAVGADTCTYTSGNWNVNCADNCTIAANTNLLGNNITFKGYGMFRILANITNIGRWDINQGCQIIIFGGQRFG